MSGPWLPRVVPRRNARLRLFLFPYAGGSASLFHDWLRAFPPEVDVLPVQLPGREERIREPPIARLDDLADAAADALLPLADRPTALFGWSMGAAIVGAVARRWEAAGRLPAVVIPAAHPAPHLPKTVPAIHDLPSKAFWREVAQLGGLPEDVLGMAELLELMEPTLRADFAVVETRPQAAPRSLSCRVTAIAAEDDGSVAAARVAAWSEATTGAATFTTIPGGHFVIRSDGATVRRAVGEALGVCGAASAPTLGDLGRLVEAGAHQS